MKEIKLTQGQITQVDDEDYEYLNQWKWGLKRGRNTCYVIRSNKVKGKSIITRMHRVIMNNVKGMVIDHIDHNGLNNQKSNLRVCTHKQNLMNKVARGKSKYLGVSYNNLGFIRARISVDLKEIHLGYFKTEEDAAKSRDIASVKYFGDFASLNFPTNNNET